MRSTGLGWWTCFSTTEDEHPETALSLSHAAAAVTDAFGRVLRLVVAARNYRLPRLQNFTVWIGTRKTTHTDVERALDTLMPIALVRGTQGTADLAVQFVAYSVLSNRGIPTG